MKLVLLFLMIFFCTHCSQGQFIRGTVKDDSGKELAYASVFIKENNKGTLSGHSGAYSIRSGSGSFTLICQYVGYKKVERTLVVYDKDIVVDFILVLQEMTLPEVIVNNKEDPALQIIRNTIAKRSFFAKKPEQFECDVYNKSQLRLRDYPKKILGKKIDFEDGDTSRNKIVFLSETVSRYSVQQPNKEKTEVISSRVSGQSDAFGLSAPRSFSFYENLVTIGNLNRRGFISPISDQALNYYRYKLQGTYFEEGREIGHIQVIPKRAYEPLFSGYLDIVLDEWRIHSVQLMLTKASQAEFIDSFRIEQIYRTLNPEIGYVSSQVIYIAAKFLGFDAYGNFVNMYSNMNSNPGFGRKTFSNTLLVYTDSAGKRNRDYWNKIRPLTLQPDEEKDYEKKDSLELARKDPRYMDSLQKIRNKNSLLNYLLSGPEIQLERKRISMSFPSLSETIFFNPAEGWGVNFGVLWTKRLDSLRPGNKSFSLSPTIRYGFANRQFCTWVTALYRFGKKKQTAISISGGKKVFQFNNYSLIGDRGNSISSLLNEKNRIKSYIAFFVRGSFKKEIGDGLFLQAGFQLQDRKPLDNRTDFTFWDRKGRVYTPNYPIDLLSANITPHRVFFTLAGITWQPGIKYIEFPNRRIGLGSKYPVFSFQYIQGFDGIVKSVSRFGKWKFQVRDDVSGKLLGKFSYRIGFGGFFKTGKNIQAPDFFHFNGNISTSASEYLNSFQLLPLYQFSNTARFYSLAHLEHHFNGFLTNKIPGFNKLNIFLVAGANAYYIQDNNYYYEFFAGIENILKQVRVDVVQGYRNGALYRTGIRVGINFRNPKPADDWP